VYSIVANDFPTHGPINVVRLAAEMKNTYDIVDDERGVIVMTASIAAFDGQVGRAAYSPSMAGSTDLL
jgi:NAD(P)-dependent dehydrogenase (short-subunit alcohol dehydrogenase family)